MISGRIPTRGGQLTPLRGRAVLGTIFRDTVPRTPTGKLVKRNL